MQDAEFSTNSTIKASSVDVNNNQAETNVIVSELSNEALLKMEVIQNLLEDSDAFGNAKRERTTYTQRLQQAAEKLGIFLGIQFLPRNRKFGTYFSKSHTQTN